MAFQKHDFVNGHVLTANEMNEIEDGIKNLENATPSSAVSSVNGQTGAVKLNADDVGALPKTTKIPSNTNELNNNSGFITNAANDLINYYLKSETYTREEINRLVAQVPKFVISVVSTLPTANISTTTIYLVGGGETGDLYTEYIYVDGAWELLGRQRVDLTGYATQTWVIGQLAGYQPKGDYALKSELPTVPTKVSEFQNDAGYLTEHQDISGKLDADKLPEAVNDALAQAKNSGEFDGEDGTSPTASVEQTEEGAVITISDVEGTTTAVVKNGQDGYTPQKGKDYVDGKDGTSLRYWWSGSVLFIESDPPSGEGSHGVDLKGPQGERGHSIHITQNAPEIDADGSTYYSPSESGLPYYDTKVNDLILCAANGDIYIVNELFIPSYNVAVTYVGNIKGAKGDDGVGIQSIGVSRTPDENGYCYIIINLTDGQQQAIPYRDGKDGTSVTVANVSESTDDGGTNTVTFSDGKKVNIKNGRKGTAGQRGTSLLNVTTAPTDYTTAVNGITPAYRIALSTVKTQSGATEVLVGDTVRYSYYVYPVVYVDASYVYCGTRVSIRGATGSAAAVTSANITSALGYTPANAETVSQLSDEMESFDGYVLTDADKAEIAGMVGDIAGGGSTTVVEWQNVAVDFSKNTNKYARWTSGVGTAVKFVDYGSNNQYAYAKIPVSVGEKYRTSGRIFYDAPVWIIADTSDKVVQMGTKGSVVDNSEDEFTIPTGGAYLYLNKNDQYNNGTGFQYLKKEVETTVDVPMSVYLSPLYNKKIVYDGDSICLGAYGSGGYARIIAEKMMGTCDNQAKGGARLTAKGSNTYHSVVDNLENLPTDGDLYCFEGGINDYWTSGMKLGSFSKSDFSGTLDKTTVCGALESIFRYALTAFVGKPICFVIPHKIQATAYTANSSGNTFEDYRNAMVGICEKYSIPYYDAFSESGLNGWNTAQNNAYLTGNDTGTADGCHPNAEGYKRYYIPQLIALFERIMPVK